MRTRDRHAPRRFFSWLGLITTTVMPAPNRASTTGPSGRSIATSAAPVRPSTATSSRNPAELCSTVLRCDFSVPRWSTIDYRVIITRPVDSACDAVGRFRRQDRCGQYSMTASSLLVPVGRHPHWCRGTTAGSLTVRRSTALSPVDGRHTPGNRRVPQYSCWTSKRQASRAVTRRHLGCIGDPSKITDTRMVHQ